MIDSNWFVAGGTIFAAGIALSASSSWREGLKQQRYDECRRAAYLLSAKIGRTVSIKTNHWDHPWRAVDETWASWAEFRAAFMVAIRYIYPKPKGIIDDSTEILKRLAKFTEQASVTREDGDKINAEFAVIVSRVEKIMDGW